MSLALVALLACTPTEPEPVDTGAPKDAFWPFQDETAARGLADIVHFPRNPLDGTALLIEDLDGDGDLDVLAAPGRAPLVALRNDAGTFEHVGVPGLDAEYVALAHTDLDGDGHFEVFAATESELLQVTLRDWTVEASQTVQAGLSNAVHIHPVDLDHDGALDLFVSQYDGEDLSLLQQPDGTFVASDLGLSIAEPSWLAATLPRSDGPPDLLVATDTLVIDYGLAPEPDPSLVGPPADRHYRSSASGWLDQAPGTDFDQQRSTMGILPTDLDGDGLLDVFLSDYGRNHAVLGPSSWRLATAELGLDEALRVDAECEDWAGDLRSCLHISWGAGRLDLDGDDAPDLVVVNGGLEEDFRKRQPVQVFLSEAEGFVPGWTGQLAAARSLAVADFTGDQRPDLLVGAHFDPVSFFTASDSVGPEHRLTLAAGIGHAEARGARVVVRYDDGFEWPVVAGVGGQVMYSPPASVAIPIRTAPVESLEVTWPSGLQQVLPVEGELPEVVYEPARASWPRTLDADGVSSVTIRLELADAQPVEITGDLDWQGPTTEVTPGVFERTATAGSVETTSTVQLTVNGSPLWVSPRIHQRVPLEAP